MVERYLCLMLSGKLHGIDLSKLVPIEDEDDEDVELEDDRYWENIWEGRKPPPPSLPPPLSFDFTLDLPARNMHVFSMDSKVFLVGGTDDDKQPCYEIYEFQCHIAAGVDDGENKKAELNPCESISKVPVYIDFYNSHIACISGEAYFLTCNDQEWCFWVLRGCGGEWERLPLNPILQTQDSLPIFYDFQSQRSQWFYSDKRLFLPSRVQEDKFEYVLCCFHLQTRQWTMEEFDRLTSFHLCSNHVSCGLPLLPRHLVSTVTGLEDYTNYSVMLSYRRSKLPGIIKIYAMLVNQNGVCVYQEISPLLFKGIKPYFRRVKEIFFVDLGEGKTCAMLFGFALQHRFNLMENIVLYVSIFTLTLKDEFDITANYAESRDQDRKFVSVHVLSRNLYTIKENLEDIDLQQVFVCPPP